AIDAVPFAAACRAPQAPRPRPPAPRLPTGSPRSMGRHPRPPAAAQGASAGLDGRTTKAGPHQPDPERFLDPRLEGSFAHPTERQVVGLAGEGNETMQHG